MKYLNMDIGKQALRGGIARAASLTPEQRKTIASNAAKVRWAKIKAKACTVNQYNKNWCDFHDRPLSRCQSLGLLSE